MPDIRSLSSYSLTRIQQLLYYSMPKRNEATKVFFLSYDVHSSDQFLTALANDISRHWSCFSSQIILPTDADDE